MGIVDQGTNKRRTPSLFVPQCITITANCEWDHTLDMDIR